jgi:hypothetical protein
LWYIGTIINCLNYRSKDGEKGNRFIKSLNTLTVYLISFHKM